MKHKVTIKDPDGDQIEIGEVCGFGEPMLAVFFEGSRGEVDAGINLDVDNARKVMNAMAEFLDRHPVEAMASLGTKHGINSGNYRSQRDF